MCKCYLHSLKYSCYWDKDLHRFEEIKKIIPSAVPRTEQSMCKCVNNTSNYLRIEKYSCHMDKDIHTFEEIKKGNAKGCPQV